MDMLLFCLTLTVVLVLFFFLVQMNPLRAIRGWLRKRERFIEVLVIRVMMEVSWDGRFIDDLSILAHVRSHKFRPMWKLWLITWIEILLALERLTARDMLKRSQRSYFSPGNSYSRATYALPF